MNTRLDRGEDWEEIKRIIYIRDDYHCRICGIVGKLHAHHIVPYSKSKDNSLTNLVTLCPTCHTKTENNYRRYGLTHSMRKMITENERIG